MCGAGDGGQGRGTHAGRAQGGGNKRATGAGGDEHRARLDRQVMVVEDFHGFVGDGWNLTVSETKLKA